MYLLRPNSVPESESALGYFRELISSISSYYHPSNGGAWSTRLSLLLRGLAEYFSKRYAKGKTKKTFAVFLEMKLLLLIDDKFFFTDKSVLSFFLFLEILPNSEFVSSAKLTDSDRDLFIDTVPKEKKHLFT